MDDFIVPCRRRLRPGGRACRRPDTGTSAALCATADPHFLTDRLPHGSGDFIPAAGLFCWEERPAQYAAPVTDRWARH